MASIYCYEYGEPKLSLLGVVDDFISFNFTRSYSGIGEWQLVLDGSSLNAQRVKGMDFISLGEDKAGLVQHYENTIEDGKHTLTFSGVELKGLTSRRIIIPPTGEAYQTITKSSPEFIIASLLNEQLLNPTDTSRKIAGKLLDYNQSTTKIRYDGRYQNLEEEIETIATTYNIGWCAYIDNNIISWKIWNGLNRTAAQTKNDRMILSYDYGTMNNSSLVVEDLVPTYMIIAGQGEGTDRAIATIDKEKAALARIETFLDARDISDENLLPQRGEQNLAEYGDEINYTATLSNQAANQYKSNFDLGDIGTIKDDKIESNLDYRITAIEEVYEDNQLQINMTFGYDKNQLKDAIKRMNNKRDSLLALEKYGSGSGAISMKDDGNGNVVISSTGTLTITDDGNGNVVIS